MDRGAWWATVHRAKVRHDLAAKLWPYVLRVVYGHKKWETVSICYLYNQKKKQTELIAWRQGKHLCDLSALYTWVIHPRLVLDHAEYLESILICFWCFPLQLRRSITDGTRTVVFFPVLHGLWDLSSQCCPVLCSVAQLCPTLCDPMNCSLPSFPVHRVGQARILEEVAIPFSSGSSRPRDWTCVSCFSCNGRRVL